MTSGTDVKRRTAGIAVMVAAAMALTGGRGAADAPGLHIPMTAPAAAAPGEVSILSYNVEGLPWPIARGRAEAAGEIADRLADQRLTGRQPHIVALQEAFGAPAKDIGRRAGYRYAAFGPAEGEQGAVASTASDRSFAAAARFWSGETIGRFADSGLAIFSDYPILWTRRLAFPGFACAGYDCLANKGVLAVALKVPGSDRPLVVIDTHLNSRAASGVPDARSFYAYSRQVDALGAVVAEARSAGDVVMAGDFNVGSAKSRSAYLDDRLLGRDGFSFAAFEHDAGHRRRSIGEGHAITAATLDRTKSLMAFEGALTPSGPVVTFGTLADGTMLSDHLGLERRFRLGA
jgi:endonuclease/exonuclease/phosphatase family metal-dependent hydrolase